MLRWRTKMHKYDVCLLLVNDYSKLEKSFRNTWTWKEWGSAIAGSIKLAIFDFRLWWQGVQNWNHHSWTSQLGKDESRNRNGWYLIFDIHWYSSFLLSGKRKLNPHEHANNVKQKVDLHFPAFTDNCLHSRFVVQSSKQFSFTDVQQLLFCFGIDSKCEKLLLRRSSAKSRGPRKPPSPCWRQF